MAELPVVKRLRKEMEILKRELNVELPKELERARARTWVRLDLAHRHIRCRSAAAVLAHWQSLSGL